MDFNKLVKKLYDIEPTDVSVSRLSNNPIINESTQAKPVTTKLSDVDALIKMAGIYGKPSTITEENIVSVQSPPNKVSMDIPLLIRLLEFAREEAEDDIIIHDIAERLVDLSMQSKTLTMDDYSSIIPSDVGRMDKEERLSKEYGDKPKSKHRKTEESIADYLRKSYAAYELKESRKK